MPSGNLAGASTFRVRLFTSVEVRNLMKYISRFSVVRVAAVILFLCVANLTAYLFEARTLYAASITVEELRIIQSKLKTSDHLSVELRQTKTSATRPNKPVIAKGRAIFSKPDKFRWTVGDPINEETIFTGKEMIKVRPTENVGVRYPAGGSESQELRRVVDLVLNMEALLERYDVLTADKSGHKVSVSMKPKSAQDIAQVNFVLDTVENYISFLELEMSSKMKLAVEFSHPNFSKVPDAAYQVGKDVRITELN